MEISSETFDRRMVFCVRCVVSYRTEKTSEAIGARFNDISLGNVSKLWARLKLKKSLRTLG